MFDYILMIRFKLNILRQEYCLGDRLHDISGYIQSICCIQADVKFDHLVKVMCGFVLIKLIIFREITSALI